ncbi:UNVERIFIED_CONTAM: hypothetical protein Q9R71_14755 [Actinomycetes bacterium ARC8]|nr:hypothetical protein [Actinomycetes bacterium ARC8]
MKLMVEVEVLDTVGRHINDHMVTFYARAPGGWDIEYGTDGMLVDETYYTAEEITEESYWGHSHEGAEPLAAFEVPSESGAVS